MKRLAVARSWGRVLPILLVLLLTSLLRAEEHEFVFDASNSTDKPSRVNLAGEFNGWSKDATPMKQVRPNVWSATVNLDEGLHHYKFVLDGGRWISDPTADKELDQDDNFGGKNSGVMIGPDPRKWPPAKPDHINPDGVLFRIDDLQDVNIAAPGAIRLRVRVQADDVQKINVVSTVHNSPNLDTVATMHKLATDRGFDVYATEVAIPFTHTNFALQLIDGSNIAYATPRGVRTSIETFEVSLRPKLIVPDWAKHAVWYQIFPERFRNGDPSNDPGDHWYESKIKWTADWWKTQPGEAPGEENFYKGKGNVWNRRYGGDIQGLREKLPYLRSLGINAIYLNPMFEADSLHKYDTTDYRHIDDNFGTREKLPLDGETEDPSTWKWSKSDKIFLDFVAEAHRQGFHVILDGVFNHVGRSHPFFQDVVKNGKASKYASWFDIQDFGSQTPADPKVFGKPGGMKFRAWDGDSGHLPVFKKEDKLGLAPGPREHVMAVTKRWLAPDGDPSKGVDGWRLDVPGDIPHPFWIEWRKMIRETKPDTYITGEIWTWAQPWLNKGDQFDAVMNYRFADAAQQFFVNKAKAITPSQFNARCVEMEFNYPQQVALVQQNLFDSHDTDRLASMFMNPDRAYDAENRIQDNAEKVGYDARKPGPEEWARFRQAVAFQMTFLGAPMIYYGDEAGMWSGDDPSNRQPMVWKDLEPYDDPQVKFDADLFAYYQRLIAIRGALSPLQLGFFRPVLVDDERSIYAFARELDGKTVYVVLNRSKAEQSADLPIEGNPNLIDWLNAPDVEWRPLPDSPTARPSLVVEGAKTMSPTGGKLSVQLKPYGTMILAEKN